MAKVEDWFVPFIGSHMARCRREDWPEGRSEEDAAFWQAWRHQFVVRGVTEEFATLASLELAGDPPRWLSDHLPGLLKAAARLRLEREPASSPGAPSSLEAARLASRDCCDCGGTGWATRFARIVEGQVVPDSVTTAYPCDCPLGGFHAEGLRQPNSTRRPRTVGQIPGLRDGHRLRPGSAPPDPDDRLGVEQAIARLKALIVRPPGRPSEASVEARREKLLSTLPEPLPEPPRPVPEPEAEPEPVEIPEQRPLPEEIDDPINWW